MKEMRYIVDIDTGAVTEKEIIGSELVIKTGIFKYA